MCWNADGAWVFLSRFMEIKWLVSRINEMNKQINKPTGQAEQYNLKKNFYLRNKYENPL